MNHLPSSNLGTVRYVINYVGYRRYEGTIFLIQCMRPAYCIETTVTNCIDKNNIAGQGPYRDYIKQMRLGQPMILSLKTNSNKEHSRRGEKKSVHHLLLLRPVLARLLVPFDEQLQELIEFPAQFLHATVLTGAAGVPGNCLFGRVTGDKPAAGAADRQVGDIWNRLPGLWGSLRRPIPERTCSERRNCRCAYYPCSPLSKYVRRPCHTDKISTSQRGVIRIRIHVYIYRLGRPPSFLPKNLESKRSL